MSLAKGAAVESFEVIRSERQLRKVVGPPLERAVRKSRSRLDADCRALIAASPFVVVASTDAKGCFDASPRGDRAGFVLVLDDKTLAIPDRPGNRRLDTFLNVLQCPGVGLLFLIPGKLETLRVNGHARVVVDQSLLTRMVADGRVPSLCLVVTVTEAFIHCGKCMLRSQLWDRVDPAAVRGLPTLASWSQGRQALDPEVEDAQAAIERSWRDNLY